MTRKPRVVRALAAKMMARKPRVVRALAAKMMARKRKKEGSKTNRVHTQPCRLTVM